MKRKKIPRLKTYIRQQLREQTETAGLEVKIPRPAEFVRKQRPWRAEPEGEFKQAAKDALLARGIQSTVPEAIVYLWLEKMGLPFEFQTILMGGRTMPGGLVADFILLDRTPPLILRVQGTYWHEHNPLKRASDEEQRTTLVGFGYTVVDLWENRIYDQLEYLMQAALAGIDLGQ